MLHVSLLGEQAITDDASGAARMRSSRTIALIAYLVVHAGAPQTRQHIAGLFWPDSTEKQALTNLRRELHALRRTLAGEPSLVVTPRQLCWQDAGTCQVDARIFTLEYDRALTAAEAGDGVAARAHAVAALAQYRGELLPGCYDEWLTDVRDVLDDRCVRLCDLVCDGGAETHDHSVAVAAARTRTRLRPLEEVGYRSLMRLQAEMGDRGGAVSTYHHCASVLERELGVDPDPATRAVFEQLLTHPKTPGAPRQPATAVASRSGLAATELVGRAREFAALQQRWRSATLGRPGLVLVRGDAGAGKTRLVTELAERTEREGAVVATAHCFGTSGRLALAPVADWLRHPAIAATTATLDPIWRAEVNRLVPQGAGQVLAGSGARAMVDAWQRHRFLEGIARALLAAGRPTLLVLDNLQWCDQESLALLTFLLRLETGAPLLVAGTMREDDLGEDPELAAWTARMRATGMLTELELSPLDAADTATIAATITGHELSDEDSRTLHAATGGFPLHVVEAARTAADGGSGAPRPGDLAGVLHSRLAQLSAPALELAGLAAAVGRNFTLDLITEASDLDAASAVGAVDEMWRRRVLREFRDGYDFSHDLLRSTAYEAVSPPRRWLLHRRIAHALELLHAEDRDVVSAQLAGQHALAGHTDRAVVYYQRAAEVAATVFAHADAVRLHNEALALVRELPSCRTTDRQELEVLQAMAAPLSARSGYAATELQRVLERTITLADRLGDNQASAGGLASLWGNQLVQGRMADAKATADALEVREPRPELSARTHFAFGGSALMLGSPRLSVEHFTQMSALASRAASLSVGTRPDVHGRAWAAHAHWLLGHDAAAATCCREAVVLARGIEHPFSLAVALAYAGITHQIRHDLDELTATVRELTELCDRYGFAYYREWALILRSWCDSGVSGVEGVRRGIDNLKADGAFARMPYWLSLLADTQRRAGDPAAATATLDAAIVDGRARADLWWLPEVLRMRAECDEPGDARARLRSAAELATRHGSLALQRRCERDIARLDGWPEVPACVPGDA